MLTGIRQRSVAFAALCGMMSAGMLGAAVQDTQSDQDRPDSLTQQQEKQAQPSRQDVMQALKQLEGAWDVTMEIKTASLTGSTQTREVNGTAERKWILDQNVLKEQATFESAQAIPGVPAGRRDIDDANRAIDDNPGQRGRQSQDRDRDRLRDPSRHDMQAAGEYESLGLFGIDESTRQISHVWADSHSGNLVLSIGRYNASEKEFTFTRHYGEDSRMRPGQPEWRGREVGDDREDSDLYDDDDDTRGVDQDRDRGREGMRHRDDDQQERGRDMKPHQRGRMTGLNPVVKLKIESEDKHVLTMTKPGGIEYTITYTRKNQNGTGASGQ